MTSANVNREINYTIYTDGSCTNNGDRTGGWGFVVFPEDIRCNGYEYKTTSNRMELIAALRALQFIKHPSIITIKSDSEYLINCMTKWILKWQNNNWLSSNKISPVKNRDILEELLLISKFHNITWKWVRGHNGNKGNEIADKLASKGRLLGVTRATPKGSYK